MATYRATLKYSTKWFEAGNQVNNEGKPEPKSNDLPPDQRPWTISTSTKMYDEILIEDKSDANDTPAGPLPVRNSAGMKFPDPVIVQRPRSVIHLSKDQTVWLFQKKLTYEGTINKTPYTIQGFQFPKETLLLSSYNAKSTFDKTVGAYWTVDLEMEYRPEGFDRKILDAGTHELVIVDAIWYLSPITDSSGQTIVGMLDGNGVKAAVDPDTGESLATYIIRKPYSKADWNQGLV